MAPSLVSMRTTAPTRTVISKTSSARLHRPAAPVSLPIARPTPRRVSIKRFSSDTGAENDDQLVNEKGEILQGHQEMKTSPMSEDKRAQTPEQSGAPEGDRAIAGQAYQPTGETENQDVMSQEAGEKATGSQKQGAGEAARQEESK